ncbi:GNAT superfamily N-acetyltransferase [Saccharothrix tamanrassetensis]|uniref:GNAT superfamily N-acetyltransferase n=1 Tax=Saccharothrix tamanrassetensis TaxID=1051531 RepID=A0A841CHM9_9PSEU|nr:GNAT family N-acetyltransferase [Saccharothrix tamanrassetensis]MBB5956809.1 GNAT superfamily N-acetyltransferase [Saccharothrix tamanrassetensis]
MEIRPARPEELPALQAIEVASGEPFREFGMPDIADDDPMPLDALRHLHVWVAAHPQPIAWVAVEPVDGYAHVEQISVDPAFARRGIGAALLDHVERWATARGLHGLTLTTFRDIPWNGPYYERLGFREVTALTPGLERIMNAEAERGLDRADRVCLRRVPGTGV